MDADDDDEDSDDDSGALGGAFDDDNGDEELRPFGGDRDFIPELDEEVSPADQEALEAFMNANATPAVSLGDLIAQKLAAAVAASKGEGGGAGDWCWCYRWIWRARTRGAGAGEPCRGSA